MVDLGLYNFLKNELAAGKTREQITVELSNANWTPEMIQDGFAAIDSNTTPVAEFPDGTSADNTNAVSANVNTMTTVSPLHVGKFKASWMLTKASFAIIRQDSLLLVFPLLEAFFVALFGIAFFGSLYLAYIAHVINVDKVPVWTLIILYFLVYLGGYFISIFFRTAMMSIVLHILKGDGNTGFFSGFGAAITRIGSLFLWALVAATVGVVVEILESNRKGMVGAMEYGAGKALEMSWRIASNFALPAILIENAKPFEAMKKSLDTLKRTWGESLFLYVGTGLFFGLLFAILLLVIAGFAFAVVYFSLPILIMYVVGAVSFVLLVALITVSSAADSIFKIVVYEYAALRESAKGFTPELLALSMGQK